MSSRREGSFTLLELLVVIAIIAVMLIAVVPAVNSLSKSNGRKAAIGSLLGALEQARANAIKTSLGTYLVFPAFTKATQTTLDRYHYKSFALFEDDPAAATTPKQLTGWKTLATGVSFRAKTGSDSVTDLPDGSALTPAVTFTFTPETTATVSFHCIKFNANGEAESIVPPATNLIVSVFEGHAEGTTEVTTSSKDAAGEPAARESIKIAHLTGRAERLQ